jgi:hypothetical protein
MKLGDMFVRLGGKLGIIKVMEMDPQAADPQGGKVVTRNVSMKDLSVEIQQEEVKTLAEAPGELSVSLADLFDAAGVKPAAHGWTIERLEGLLSTEQYKTMDRSSVQKAILGFLANDKVPVEDLVKDAMQRDKTVDDYEAHLRNKMADRQAGRQRKIAELQSQIKDLEKQCLQQNEEGRVDKKRWREWLDKKIAYEKAMAAALSYLVEHPQISITPPEAE